VNEQDDSSTFYDRIPVFRGFPQIMDESLYRPLPQDWLIGTTDIVGSTREIQENRYKAVNMAGAAIIAALSNALGREFPFVFGGDGASFAVPPAWADIARKTVAETLRWASEELALQMRGAFVPVKEIRDQGLDVRVARFGPSQDVSYAMFMGGGIAFAEAAMKEGRFAVEPAPSGSRPDLSGLSCRFEEIPSRHGVVLAVLVMPGEHAESADFRRVVEELVLLAEQKAFSPLPPGGPAFAWPNKGTTLEAHASRHAHIPLLLRRFAALARTFLYYLIFRFRLRVGRFVPGIYLQQLVANSDFRKYDDALRMIIDCTPELADEIERKLSDAADAGIVRFGLHRQHAAMMTCFAPFPAQSDHMHFIDGASGGYALAALALKGGGASGVAVSRA